MLKKFLVDFLFNQCKKDDDFLRSACEKLVNCFFADVCGNPSLLISLFEVPFSDIQGNLRVFNITEMELRALLCTSMIEFLELMIFEKNKKGGNL